MQYSIYINQTKAIEWSLTPQQSILFSFLYELPSWADCHIISGIPYYYITKKKILAELPLLNSKPDTVYRWIRTLTTLGLIRIIQQGPVSLVGITAKGAAWNREATLPPKEERVGCVSEGSDVHPRLPGCASDLTSDVHPTNHITNNHITKPYHHAIPPQIESDISQNQINEYLALVVNPMAQCKDNPRSYIESVKSRIMQSGFSDRDIVQMDSARSLSVKSQPVFQPAPRHTVVSESWETAKRLLESQIHSPDFNLWIEPLRCVRDDTVIELAGPDRFFCAHIKANFLERIQNVISGKEVHVRPEI
ncbi:MAG: hypothetical protein KKF37_14590 [Proteobacteria bacterium]|nr:hypothetical protein [Pseudomonadota bacterium]